MDKIKYVIVLTHGIDNKTSIHKSHKSYEACIPYIVVRVLAIRIWERNEINWYLGEKWDGGGSVYRKYEVSGGLTKVFVLGVKI